MRLRHYLFVSLLGLALALVVAYFQSGPGYMDASYYMAGGVWLADGDGFNEQILWNYLDDPHGLPHPSHGYWMPLTSVLAAQGMRLMGAHTFTSARLGFLLLAALIPVITAWLSYSLSGRRDWAILAGIIAAISGFYLPYLPTIDAFGLYMLFGGLFLLVIQSLSDGSARSMAETGGNHPAAHRANQLVAPIILGFLAGMMHLTRADGLLWLFVAIIFAPRDSAPRCKGSQASFVVARNDTAGPNRLFPGDGAMDGAQLFGFRLIIITRRWTCPMDHKLR